MNLHPLTVVLLLALAYLFYSQGQLFFFFATLAIGFLLLIVSISGSSSSSHSESHGSSLYPEKMEIKISGDDHVDDGDGQKEMSESIGGAIDFTGKLFGKVFGMTRAKAVKDEDTKEGGH
ncbi:MAG: hypothetical protein Q8R15_03330 [Candidatus Micrarchaeota archaeon]|nr:hypothetical protein [Candidatus Micrarchaeota archaeon]